jgi:hypothetical protein
VTRKLVCILLFGLFYGHDCRADAERLGIFVEIRSPRLVKVYSPFANTMVAPAIAESLRVKFTGDEKKKIKPVPPLDQWNLVVVADQRTERPPNHLIFTIDEVLSGAQVLNVEFVSEVGGGSVGVISEIWRQPGSSTAYPSPRDAGEVLAQLFVERIFANRERFEEVANLLRVIPLATARWTMDDVRIALPLPALRHNQLRDSEFRIYGEWGKHRHATEIGGVEIIARASPPARQFPNPNYLALTAVGQRLGEELFANYADCTKYLNYQRVFLEKYKIPSSTPIAK